MKAPLHWWERVRDMGDVVDEQIAHRNHRRQLSEGLRDNVLHGLLRRDSPAAGLEPPSGPPRQVNVTFCVDDLALKYARARALVEGTSVNAIVCRLLEEYSGVHREPQYELSRRIPRFGRYPSALPPEDV